MNPILSAKQMQAVDNRTITELGIPSLVLMENAGRQCATMISDIYQDALGGTIAILCGSGNNGGDGAVIARWLKESGSNIIILHISSKAPTPETKANLKICEKLSIPVITIENVNDYNEVMDDNPDLSLIIDAIFGIGFKGELSQKMHQIIKCVNEEAVPIVAIDIPSGIDADNGTGANAIKASVTLALGAYKYGHFLAKGAEYSGKLYLVDIGIPGLFYRVVECGRLLELADIRIPDRYEFADKTAYGSVAVFAGSPGLTGAAVLACQAALRSGAGLITLYHQPDLAQIFEIKLTEVMTRSIPEDGKGLPDTAAVMRMLDKHTTILIGPGIGQDDHTLKLMECVLTYKKDDQYTPMVIDADGLRLLAKHRHLMDHLADREIVLTPHIREFAALTEASVSEINRDTITYLKHFVGKYRCKVLLKGRVTIYCDDQYLLFNKTGNDGLATGGTGDVLAGMITAYLAQKMPLPWAAISASQVMGLTANNISKNRLCMSITPSDLIDHLFLAAKGDDDA